jgi:hypothetical protein
MAELRAPEQNRLLGQLARMLRTTEGDIAAPEFLPRGLDVMGLVRQLMLPSAETVEKLSYGDPLFRIPTQSNIPITADREYLAEVLGMAPAVPAASRATTRLSNEAADQLVRAITRNPEATAPQVLEAAGQMLPLSRAYRPTTPLNPDPSVGTRFEREFTGGLAEKTPVNLEDLQGSSVMIMPWDSTSRNYKVTSVSDELLPSSVITHGGQDYARDLAHIEQGVGGASNLAIAKRIRDRDTQARIENLEAGGTGQIIHLPATMGEGAENFSVMPTEVMLGVLDKSNPSKKLIKELDKEIREFKVFKGTGEKRVATQPFKKFKGVMTEEGRMQLYTGEGLGSTAGELRKAFVNRMSMKKNQEEIGFNAEDISAALTDPSLAGIGKGYVGNTVIATGEGGMRLIPAVNPTYSTNFTGQYLGTLGENVPVETLFPRLFPQLMQEFAGKKGDIRNMALGALEKRKQGVSELIDQQVIDNYYNYLNEQRALGLLD